MFAERSFYAGNRVRNSAGKSLTALRSATLALSLMMGAVPAFAAAPAYARHSSGGYLFSSDSSAKALTHNGFPCSTTALAASGLKTEGSRRQLDQIEHQGLLVTHGTSARGNAVGYRTTSVRGSGRSSGINFSYHAGGAAGRSAVRRR